MKLLKINLEEQDIDNLLFFIENARLDSDVQNAEEIYDSVEAVGIEMKEDLGWHTKINF